MTTPTRPAYRWGGWTVIFLIAASCWLCGFACALFV